MNINRPKRCVRCLLSPIDEFEGDDIILLDYMLNKLIKFISTNCDEHIIGMTQINEAWKNIGGHDPKVEKALQTLYKGNLLNFLKDCPTELYVDEKAGYPILQVKAQVLQMKFIEMKY